MISRTRLIGDSNSLGVITNPGDETVGLSDEQMERVTEIQKSRVPNLGINPAARQVRDPKNGLLLIYPVSKKSGHERLPPRRRRKIYDNPEDPKSKDIICLAISFPRSNDANQIWGQYIVGTAGWSPL